MHDDQVQGEMGPEVEKNVNEHIDSVDKLLPFLEAFSNKEKNGFHKPGDELLSLARIMPSIIERHQDAFPKGLINGPELTRDLALYDDLIRLENRIQPLMTKIQDTIKGAAHDIAAQLFCLNHVADLLEELVPELRNQLQPVKDYFQKKRGKKKKPQSDDSKTGGQASDPSGLWLRSLLRQ